MGNRYYTQACQIETAIGNNALSFDARKTMGSPCILTIPQLKSGTWSDVIFSDNIGFEEIDHHCNLHTCKGLQHLISIEKTTTNPPTYIMDNHNHALYFWLHAHVKNTIPNNIPVIHIDQHADMGSPIAPIDHSQIDNLSYIATYANEICNVGSFILPCIDTGVIGEVHQIRTVSKLLTYTVPPTYSYILDIDIDFWSSHTPTQAEKEIVQSLYQHASLCTIALSPYFIDGEKSIKIMNQLFG